jgi:EAL domain-containing protein (putative c-di-GMP-specific phosphodiesterase class I)
MTTDKPSQAFNLPYNQSEHYWLAVFYPGENTPLRDALHAYGLKQTASGDDVCLLRLTYPWEDTWKVVHDILVQHDAVRQTQVALIPGELEPGMEELGFKRKQPEMLDTIASSLWLGDALIDDRIVCYMQPVLDKRGKVFGYEAFARVETEKGVIAGGAIIEASKGLSAEYILDRHLHIKAITSFISSDLEGFLFINFVPGFIHRPEKYLEGLTDAAKFHGMPAKQLVLDFTQSENPQDLGQMKSIFDYCRSKGYSLSLDDISSVGVAKRIFDSIRPDFVKIDRGVVRDIASVTQMRNISDIVQLAHAAGATVIAEGVETESVHQELLKVGVDLFQGYLFSPPVAVSALKKAVS